MIKVTWSTYITKNKLKIYIFIYRLVVVGRITGINSLLAKKTLNLLINLHLITIEENLVLIDNLNLSC